MVFYFIIFLSIILFSCVPFRIKICFYYSFLQKKLLLRIQVGFFKFNKIIKRSKTKAKKKKRTPIRFYLKKISFKKPIDFRLNFYSRKNTVLQHTENALLHFDAQKICNLISKKNDKIHIKLHASDSYAYDCFLHASVTLNLFLIISSALQTIKIGRKK